MSTVKPKHNQENGMTVPMGRIRRFVKKMETLDDKEQIKFEMIMVAFFPDAWNNIQRYSNECFLEGFRAGRASMEKKNED